MDEMSRKKLEEILIKDVNNLSSDDVAFLRARRSYLKESDKETLKKILNDNWQIDSKTNMPVKKTAK